MLYGLLKGSYKDFIKAGKNDRKNRAFCMIKNIMIILNKIKLKTFYLINIYLIN